jgi:hypothetical protein
MPSVSKRQHALMAMVAHNPKAAKRVGISQKVGKHFMQADKGKRFAKGDLVDNDLKFKPNSKVTNAATILKQTPTAYEMAAAAKEKARKSSDNDERFIPDPKVTKPETLNLSSSDDNLPPKGNKKGGLMKESKAMAQAEMKALKRGHAPKNVMEHERKEHKEMGYKKGGHVKHAPKHHKKHMRRGGVSARMARPPMSASPGLPPGLAGALAGMGGSPAGMASPAPMASPGMKRGGHVHVSHHHHYAKGGGINTSTKKGPEAMIGGKSHKGHHGDEAAKKGHTKAKMVKMASGGHVGSHKHRRADGAAMRGHTNCKMR